MKFVKKNSGETTLKSLQKILIEALKDNSLENMQAQEKVLQRNKTKRNLNQNFLLKASHLFQTSENFTSLIISHLITNKTIDNFISAIQMTNTSAFLININKNNDSLSETVL